MGVITYQVLYLDVRHMTATQGLAHLCMLTNRLVKAVEPSDAGIKDA
jgi:hypothetical protein